MDSHALPSKSCTCDPTISKEVILNLPDDLNSVVSVALELWERFNSAQGRGREGFTKEVTFEMH